FIAFALTLPCNAGTRRSNPIHPIHQIHWSLFHLPFAPPHSYSVRVFPFSTFFIHPSPRPRGEKQFRGPETCTRYPCFSRIILNQESPKAGPSIDFPPSRSGP